jgi:hypothetical protein
MILAGAGLFGSVDQLPGPLRFRRRLCIMYVGTRFIQITGVPVVPLRSYVVIATPGILDAVCLSFGFERPIAAIPISFSWKSVILAYARAFLLMVHVSAPLGAGFLIYGLLTPGLSILGLCLCSAVLFWLSYRFAYADSAREQELLDVLAKAHESMMRK